MFGFDRHSPDYDRLLGSANFRLTIVAPAVLALPGCPARAGCGVPHFGVASHDAVTSHSVDSAGNSWIRERPSLTGVVRSAEEGPLEGVLVSAQRVNTPVTVTVVSDASGRYSFPRNRLDPANTRSASAPLVTISKSRTRRYHRRQNRIR
jgi:hypothetical protein